MCDAYPFLHIAQLGAGPHILKLTKYGQCMEVLDVHISTHRLMICKETPCVFLCTVLVTISDQQLFASNGRHMTTYACTHGHHHHQCTANNSAL